MDEWARGFAYGLILMVYITTFFYLILSFISSLIIKKFFKAWNKHLINFISSFSGHVFLSLLSLLPAILNIWEFGKYDKLLEIIAPIFPRVIEVWLIIAPFVFLELIDIIKQPKNIWAKIGFSFLVLAWVIISPIITLRLHLIGF